MTKITLIALGLLSVLVLFYICAPPTPPNLTIDKNLLMAPSPPMEVQPEIGDMITQEEWDKAKTPEARQALVNKAFMSRHAHLKAGFEAIEATVKHKIEVASARVDINPKNKLKIYQETKEEIENLSFGPATAALPKEKWIQDLQQRLDIPPQNNLNN